MKVKNLSPQKAKELYQMLPKGRENAISRSNLCKLWSTHDRNARLLIAELRKMDFGDPYIIISSSNGKGYYLSDNVHEIEDFVDEMRSRALNIFAPLKKANRILIELNNKTPRLDLGGE